MFTVCQKGTVGCVNAVMRELSHILRAVRNVFALSGKDQGPGAGNAEL